MITSINPVHIDANVEDLVATAIELNFVPVADDGNVFVEIIKKSDIIKCLYEKSFEESGKIA